MVDRSGQQIDKYRLSRRLGSGSFGEVYLAERKGRKKQFAVKILYAHLSNMSDKNVEEFFNEARASRLIHPNIVRIEDFGIDNGTPFLVMDYISGGTLCQHHPRGTRLSLKTIISYVQQIAEALDYAHEEELVHRDVKPENLLIGPNNEILLGDFGIVTTSSTVNQMDQKAAGTPAYMAPEQIKDKPVRASDQYALAVIAYEWLTGTLPFQGTWQALFYQHVSDPPPPLREKVPTISSEVEQVVLRALAKDPTQRFTNVREFAAALEQASRPPLGTTLLTYSGHCDWVNALAWSSDGTRIASASSDTTVHVWDAANGEVICTYHGHAGSVNAVVWSPDSTYIASGSSDGTVQVWQATTGDSLLTYHAHSDDVLAVAWSPDGTSIASAGNDRIVQVWQAMTRDHVCTYSGHAREVEAVAWSLDGTRIASGSYDTTVQIWQAATGNVLLVYPGHSGSIYAVTWAPDGTRIASGSYDTTVQVRDAAAKNTLLTYRGHTDGIFAVSWSPNGEYLASGGDDKTVQVWEATTGNTLFVYNAHASGVRALAWSPDSFSIASGGLDNTVRVWQAVR